MASEKGKKKSKPDACGASSPASKRRKLSPRVLLGPATKTERCSNEAAITDKKGNGAYKRYKCPSKRKTIISKSNDDFVDDVMIVNPKDVKCRRRGMKQPQCKEQKAARRKLPSLNTRTTPTSLHDKLLALNEAQKDAIREIGFGKVLELKVKKLPGKLAYWVLERFNSRNYELELADGCKVKVTEDDVYMIFGFPKGTERIENFERYSINELCEQWVSFFGVESRENIKIGLVVNEMVNCTSGGTWFKRHFMIAMASSLIESCTSGTAHPYILRCLENVHTLKKWNWGEYVLRSLIDHKRSWVADKTKVFVGPALFLLLFYVDKVEIHRKLEPRDFPVLTNWSSVDLRKRQKRELDDGYFGDGSLCEPIMLPDEYSSDVGLHTKNINGDSGIGDVEEGVTCLATKIIKKTIFIGEHMEQLRNLIHSASVVDKDSQFYIDSVKAACKITGLKVDIHGPRPRRHSQNISIDDDLFYYRDEVLASVDAASAKAEAEKTRTGISRENMPSFDLHLSQGRVHEADKIALKERTENPLGDSSIQVGANTKDDALAKAPPSDKMEDRLETSNKTGVDIRKNDTSAQDKSTVEAEDNFVLGVARSEASCGGKWKKAVGNEDSEVGASKDVVERVVRRSARVKGADVVAVVGQVEGVDGQTKKYGCQKHLPLGNIDQNIIGFTPQNGKTPFKSLLLKTTKFRSPFVQRQISTTKSLNKCEKKVGVYALYTDTDKMDEVVFCFSDIELRMIEMHSLRRGNVVGMFIINAWTVVLNGKDQYRSDTSPARFFATTNIYMDCLAPTNCGYEEQKDSFFLTLTSELNDYQKCPLAIIDLFFFPVYKNQQYYALCFDTRHERLYILDSTVDITEEQKDLKYDDVCNDLRQMLSDYLYYMNEERKAKLVANSMEHVVKMKWGDKKNTIDTDVYLMRHLEMGDAIQGWKCNISTTSPQQLNIMCVRYCASILTWEGNKVQDGVLSKASINYREMSIDPNFKVNLMLLG